jgi:hypothetical protein
MIQHLDPVVNRLLVSDGYTIINDFLKPAQITQLKDLYSGIKQTETKGKMYSNIQDLGYDACMRIEEAIMNICEESVKKHFKHYKIAACSFLVKGYGKNSDSRLHQDWNIVDERIFKSYVLWIPLVDVDIHNGCLQVLPQAHNWFNTIRSSNIDSIHLKFNYLLDKFLVSLPMKVTDAAVYSVNLFHGSKENKSLNERPAVAITLVDDTAEMIHYVKSNDNNIFSVKCDKKFIYSSFFKLHNGILADIEINKTIDIKDYTVLSEIGLYFTIIYKKISGLFN